MAPVIGVVPANMETFPYGHQWKWEYQKNYTFGRTRRWNTIHSEPYKYIHHMYLLYYIILIYSHYVVVSISFFFLCSRKIPILTIFQFCWDHQLVYIAIGSMYGAFTQIQHTNQRNVGKYTWILQNGPLPVVSRGRDLHLEEWLFHPSYPFIRPP